MTVLLTAAEAADRLRVDGDILRSTVREHHDGALTDHFTVHGGPLGDFCESLHDLVAHVLMWDEVSLAVLTEERLGRRHWSLELDWEAPEIGAALNRGGVLAGRELPSDLLVQRFEQMHAALVDEVAADAGHDWTAIGSTVRADLPSRGAVAQHVMTIPGQPAYWHAAIHLGQPARVAGVKASA